jgi:peptidoglycan L-alanyl-D-glutamate endopeptidase CwlK
MGRKKMAYKLSERSLSRLVGVDDAMRAVTELAIEYTTVDYGVTCGLRTVEEQRELVEAGASQTMNSRHITGQAVDVVAYVGPRISWELNLYDNITEWNGSMEEAMNAYVDLRRRQGKRPFIDAPHFELSL